MVSQCNGLLPKQQNSFSLNATVEYHVGRMAQAMTNGFAPSPKIRCGFLAARSRIV